MKRVFSRPEYYCSKCGSCLYAQSFFTGLYGFFYLFSHEESMYCDQRTRFFWNPEEHLIK